MFAFSRREFIRHLACCTAAASFARFLHPAFAVAEAPTSGVGKNLILLNCEGGLDFLSAFPCISDPQVGDQSQGFVQYLKDKRPGAYLLPQDDQTNPTQTYLINSYLGLHPNLAPIYPAVGLGNLAAIQSIGIDPGTVPNGSHNFSQNAYSFGTSQYSGGGSEAWFAKLIEVNGLVNRQAFGFGTLGRLDFATQDPKLGPLVGYTAASLNYSDPTDTGKARRALTLQTARQLLALEQDKTAAQEKISSGLLNSYDSIDFIEAVIQETSSGGTAPLIGDYRPPGLGWLPQFGEATQSIARLINYFSVHDPNRPRVYYLYQPGYDHHQSLTTGMGDNLNQLAGALRGLMTDLRNPSRSNWQNTVIIMFSEFGRSIILNGGAGLDHGWGGGSFALGGPVRGGVYGDPPRRAELIEKNLYSPTLAFQNLFAAAVRWLGFDDTQIFPPATYMRNLSFQNSLFQ